MELGTALGAGWASGISAYGVVAALGIAGRAGWTDAPGWTEEPAVIAVALVLFVVELVVDKVPFLDSTWDTVHTVVRPVVGAAVAAGGDDGAVAALATGGGLLALAAHAAKATTRLVVNASPEPFSNVVVSLAEDGAVATVMALALTAPEVALAVTAVLALASVAVAVTMFHVARLAWRRAARRGARGVSGRRPSPSG